MHPVRCTLLSTTLILAACSSGGGDGGGAGPGPGPGPGTSTVDLEAVSLTASPATFGYNEEFRLTLTMRNSGTGFADKFSLRLDELPAGGGLPLNTYESFPFVLAGGASSVQTIVIPPHAAAASVIYRARVDSFNVIAESDETDNQIDLPLSIGPAQAIKPDLRVGFGTVTPSNPEPGNSVQVPIIVRNDGTATSGTCTLTCWTVGPLGEVAGSRVTEGHALNAGQTAATRFYNFSATQGAGTYTVYVDPDTTNAVQELQESIGVERREIGVGVIL